MVFLYIPKHTNLGGSAERADRRGGAFGADRGDVEVLIATRFRGQVKVEVEGVEIHVP